MSVSICIPSIPLGYSRQTCLWRKRKRASLLYSSTLYDLEQEYCDFFREIEEGPFILILDRVPFLLLKSPLERSGYDGTRCGIGQELFRTHK